MRSRHFALLLIVVSLYGTDACADELSVFGGSGPQAGSDQRNSVIGFEYSFFSHERSTRQQLQVGVAVARYRTNSVGSEEFVMVSVYPQLTFYPPATGQLARAMPNRVLPFFYARMLGPAWISEPMLGDRSQANHFAFHAQVGTGILFESRRGRQFVAHISWRHISNANLYSPNDGIDVPVLLTLGTRF